MKPLDIPPEVLLRLWNDSIEEIARELRAQAVRLWGEQRAGELEASLKQTALQLWEVGQVTPPRDLEPAFYQ